MSRAEALAMVRMGDIWDRTVEFLGDHLGHVLPLAIFAIFVPNSVNESLAPLWQTGSGGTKVALFLLYLALTVVQMWGQLAIVALAIDPAIGRNAGRVATARLLPAIGVLLALMAVATLALVPLSLMFMASGVDMASLEAGTANAAPSGGMALAVVLYGIALLALGLFVAARLSVLWPVVAAERRGIGALPRAFALTRGLAWRIVGVLILFGIVYGVAVLAAKTVVGSVMGLIAGGEGPVTVGGVITAIIVAAVAAGFSTLATAFCAKLYVAARDRRAAAETVPADAA